MTKINKGYNLKIISLIVAGIFLLNSAAYCIDISNKPCLRVPVGIDKGRAIEVILRSQIKEEKINLSEIKFIGIRRVGDFSIAQEVKYKEEEGFAKWAVDREHKKYILSEAKNLIYLESKGVKGIPKIKHLFRTEKGMVIMFLEKFSNGETLAEKMRKLSQNEAIDISLKVSKIVKSLLDNGIYHWDIAPNNIWVTDKGEIVLFDFGISFKFGSKKFINNELYMYGNPRYIPPNRLSTHRTYSQSDEIYSLSIILAETLGCVDITLKGYELMKSIMDHVSNRNDLKIFQPILERAFNREYGIIGEFIKDLESAQSQMVFPIIAKQEVERYI
jgi:serine/threonine protein kinase